jgi:hypothetical protein
VFALLSLSCGAVRQAAHNQKKINDLKQMGLAYINYCVSMNKGPANADDLLPYLENDTLFVQRVKSEFTIIWGVNLQDTKSFEPQGLNSTVLGYETTVPTSGGPVLMASGEVRQMTAAEFKAAPQAKASTGAPALVPGPAPADKDKDKGFPRTKDKRGK